MEQERVHPEVEAYTIWKKRGRPHILDTIGGVRLVLAHYKSRCNSNPLRMIFGITHLHLSLWLRSVSLFHSKNKNIYFIFYMLY